MVKQWLTHLRFPSFSSHTHFVVLACEFISPLSFFHSYIIQLICCNLICQIKLLIIFNEFVFEQNICFCRVFYLVFIICLSK